jgi:hypothetical protein
MFGMHSVVCSESQISVQNPKNGLSFPTTKQAKRRTAGKQLLHDGERRWVSSELCKLN